MAEARADDADRDAVDVALAVRRAVVEQADSRSPRSPLVMR
ncbi:MAG: hypothetical protein QOC92_862 [Acidimicrobiaceae bacterium]